MQKQQRARDAPFVVFDRRESVGCDFRADGVAALVHLKVTGFRIMRTLWIARHRGALDHLVAESFIRMLRQKSAAKAA